jgi:peptide chain release factor 1
MNDAVVSLEAQISLLDARIQEASVLLSDPDLGELAQIEIKELENQKLALKAAITSMTTVSDNRPTSDPDTAFDHSNAIIEIRGGAGGEEAKLFADDLMRMYLRYAEVKKFKIEVLDEGVVKIKKNGAFGIFKYESGVHRVQRVPETESSGRIHTSTATVAVLPEVTPQEITIRDEDLDWKFTRAGGHGGQNVNKVNTAVMLTHIPSGLVVHCRQERFQQQNKVIALDILRSKLWEIEEEKRLGTLTTARRLAVGRAMRSEKIRTYNYPENRVTDHRIHVTWHNLEAILEGDLDPIFEALKHPPVENPEPATDSPVLSM